ncbi:MAG: DNA primase DnaG [Candidatus Bathyarchaeota archaeon]
MSNSHTVPTAKYVIRARLEVNGVVEKPDVIGAIFGQTEGLFGSDLDIRELQKNNRVSRIDVDMKAEHNKTRGTITVISSLDRASTAILAAAIESVDRVGPCDAKVSLDKIEDVRDGRRKHIVKRAKELLKRWSLESTSETEELVRETMDVLKPIDPSVYGPEQLPAGPDISSASSIIIVEGRADVITLLRCGIRNVIAIGGARVPGTVVSLSKEKETTVFLDGDRAGDLILKELMQSADFKYVARAPPGKEVEDLTCKDVLSALKEKVSISGMEIKHARVTIPSPVLEIVNKLKGTLEAALLNDQYEVVAQLSVSELAEKLPSIENVNTIVFDGIVTQRLVDLAAEKDIKYLIGDRVSELIRRPAQLRMLTFAEVAP